MSRVCGGSEVLRRILLALLVGGATGAQAQLEEPINLVGQPMGIGARALGLGGAYVAAADDYTALYWNPAGLALIRKTECNLGLSHTRHRDEATAFGVSVTDRTNQTRLNAAGLVLPVPTYRGSLVFAFGYHRPRTFDNSFAFRWFNPTPNDRVTQQWNEFEDGYLDVWSAGGAIDVSPDLSVGLSMSRWGGKNSYQWTLREYDSQDLYTFAQGLDEDNIHTSVKAYEFKVGALYRLGSLVRLGATLTLPRTFTFSEEWSQNSKTQFDNGSQEVYREDGSWEYQVEFPFVFSAGASLHLLNLMGTGEIEVIDWSQVKYATDPPQEGVSRTEANLAIHENYRTTTNLKLGAEFTIPGLGLQLRGGAALVPSPLRNVGSEFDRKYFSLGVGLLLDKQLKVDLSWTRGNWSQKTEKLSEDLRDLTERVHRDLFMATVAFRF
ncbi:MAG: outer membrane protein transport protein [candidate division KSB1 bacterium]|nr:outer membrane protein transport protein [candidate division KSB1 bacterium]